MIQQSYVDKFNVFFYYADNLKVSSIVSIIFFLKIVKFLGENSIGFEVENLC